MIPSVSRTNSPASTKFKCKNPVLQFKEMVQTRLMPHLMHKAVCALQAGMIVAVPTDTVYGLCAAADNAHAVARQCTKCRPPSRGPAPLFLTVFSPPFRPPKRDKAGWHWRGRAAARRTSPKLLRVIRIGPITGKQIQICIRCI